MNNFRFFLTLFFQQSVWFSLFKGRIALIEHNLEQAKNNFESCVLLKNRLDIKQLTILYHWELIWCYALVFQVLIFFLI